MSCNSNEMHRDTFTLVLRLYCEMYTYSGGSVYVGRIPECQVVNQIITRQLHTSKNVQLQSTKLLPNDHNIHHILLVLMITTVQATSYFNALNSVPTLQPLLRNIYPNIILPSRPTHVSTTIHSLKIYSQYFVSLSHFLSVCYTSCRPILTSILSLTLLPKRNK